MSYTCYVFFFLNYARYKYVSNFTIKLLEEGFDLQGHLLSLRHYHFMELADWADSFITSLWNHVCSFTFEDYVCHQVVLSFLWIISRLSIFNALVLISLPTRNGLLLMPTKNSQIFKDFLTWHYKGPHARATSIRKGYLYTWKDRALHSCQPLSMVCVFSTWYSSASNFYISYFCCTGGNFFFVLLLLLIFYYITNGRCPCLRFYRFGLYSGLAHKYCVDSRCTKNICWDLQLSDSG